MNLKELYQIARQALEDLYGELLDFRLEQVEHDDDSGWEVVVSYLVENKNEIQKTHGTSLIPSARFEYKYERIYKSLKISDNKEVVGFHMFAK